MHGLYELVPTEDDDRGRATGQPLLTEYRGERSSRVSLRGDRIAAECRRVHYKMHYLRDTFAIALRPAIFLAGERFYIVRTVVDRKSAYRYHRAALLFPFHPTPPRPATIHASCVHSLYSLRNEKSRCAISRDKTDALLIKSPRQNVNSRRFI